VVGIEEATRKNLTLLRRKARSLRPWMNAWRVPYEAHTSVVGYASEGSALRSMWRSHGLQPVGGAPLTYVLHPFYPCIALCEYFYKVLKCLFLIDPMAERMKGLY